MLNEWEITLIVLGVVIVVTIAIVVPILVVQNKNSANVQQSKKILDKLQAQQNIMTTNNRTDYLNSLPTSITNGMAILPFQGFTQLALQQVIQDTVVPLLTTATNNYLSTNPISYAYHVIVGKLGDVCTVKIDWNNIQFGQIVNLLFWNIAQYGSSTANTYLVTAIIYIDTLTVSGPGLSNDCPAYVTIQQPPIARNIFLQICFSVTLDLAPGSDSSTINVSLTNWTLYNFMVSFDPLNLVVDVFGFPKKTISVNDKVSGAITDNMAAIIQVFSKIPSVNYSLKNLGGLAPGILSLLMSILQSQININPTAGVMPTNLYFIGKKAYINASSSPSGVACIGSCNPSLASPTATPCALSFFDSGTCLLNSFFNDASQPIMVQMYPNLGVTSASKWLFLNPGLLPTSNNLTFYIQWPGVNYTWYCKYDTILQALQVSQNTTIGPWWYLTVGSSTTAGTYTATFSSTYDPINSCGFILNAVPNNTDSPIILSENTQPTNAYITYYNLLNNDTSKFLYLQLSPQQPQQQPQWVLTNNANGSIGAYPTNFIIAGQTCAWSVIDTSYQYCNNSGPALDSTPQNSVRDCETRACGIAGAKSWQYSPLQVGTNYVNMCDVFGEACNLTPSSATPAIIGTNRII